MHSGFFRRAISLAMIATLAARYQIIPRRIAAAQRGCT
jgi:hypothetical protein